MNRLSLSFIFFVLVTICFYQNAFSFNDTYVSDLQMVERTLFFNADNCLETLNVKNGDNVNLANCNQTTLEPNEVIVRLQYGLKNLKSGGYLNYMPSTTWARYGQFDLNMNGGGIDEKKSKSENLKLIEDAFREAWPDGIKFNVITKKVNPK